MEQKRITRRDLLKATGGALAGAAALEALRSLEAEPALAGRTLLPAGQQTNPLGSYPDRNWEEVYGNQYAYDSTFTWVCSPNDTHACRLRAFMRNGVVLRSEQNYDYQRYQDLYGNTASSSWNPRGCKKGYTFHRRVYGPYRLRYPLMRKGWKQWADDGFPELTPATRSQYRFDSRGQDELLRASWQEAQDYVARAMIAIARRYSGEEGKQRLLAQGYPEEMLTWWEGAGTRTMKFRGGMGLLGVIGKYGMYRFSNMMALLDSHVRGVGPDKAKGGRNWSNYT
ncbi:MAG: molybdopterin-dependent oxidoreductase, partial [Chloroflexi bacterium]|nr:molybdopterin-dependent oxidoreductase [Chloroflexota bacterium]